VLWNAGVSDQLTRSNTMHSSSNSSAFWAFLQKGNRQLRPNAWWNWSDWNQQPDVKERGSSPTSSPQWRTTINLGLCRNDVWSTPPFFFPLSLTVKFSIPEKRTGVVETPLECGSGVDVRRHRFNDWATDHNIGHFETPISPQLCF